VAARQIGVSGAHNMTAYYNEFDPKAAAMLRQLITDGLIAPGDVDERSIEDVRPDDLKPYTQCHFFAGIGGWSVALRLAMWPDDRPVWTGSCPCQPFSTAGKGKGKADKRHLWPVWFRLIRESRPPVVFGEQVSAAIRHGWWDDVADDLEREGYATRAEIRPACSVGAPHKRDRLWFVADPSLEWAGGHGEVREQNGEPPRGGRPSDSGFEGDDVADSASEGFSLRGSAQSDRPEQVKQSERFCGNGDVADTNQPRPQGRELHPERAGERAPWADGMEWLECPDGKRRPVKSGLRLLAHGVQHRAPILHAFGNAIVSKVAAAFITSAER